MYTNIKQIDIALEENTKKYVNKQMTQKEYLKQLSHAVICYEYLKHEKRQKEKIKRG